MGQEGIGINGIFTTPLSHPSLAQQESVAAYVEYNLSMTTIVALDLETTGLDPRSDSITEIGAVKFNQRRVEAEWSSLINPGKAIPKEITLLTGITNEMVRNAPHLHDVLHEFSDFVGDAPVLGHNIPFDLSFLQPKGILRDNPVLDTYELAAILLPRASRYNLGALCLQLGLLQNASHRALDDARATHALFTELFKKAQSLPLPLIADFARLGEPLEWGAWWVMSEILKDHAYQAVDQSASDLIMACFQKIAGKWQSEPLEPLGETIPLDPEEVASLFEHGGPFAKKFETYELRSQQIDMLRAVTEALSHEQHLMIEAGTGTGKSFAYLAPAALWALQNQKRVVISTNTINLQEQLIQKDIPEIIETLNVTDLCAAVLKGRGNYVCPRRFEAMRFRSPSNVDEMRILAKVMVWMAEGGSGDLSQINLNGPIERQVWRRLSADNEGCRSETCLGRMGGVCPSFQAKMAAQTAHLLIVNHALLLADVATGSRVLPEYEYLIVDEAHHLESATTNALSVRITEPDVSRLLRELGGSSSGLLGHILAEIKIGLRPSDFAGFQKAIKRATDLAFRLEHDFRQLFEIIALFLEAQRGGEPVGQYGQQVRITPALRTQPDWGDVEIIWEQTNETLKLLLNLLEQIHHSIGNLDTILPEELEDAQSELGNLSIRILEWETHLNAFVNHPDEYFIYWVDLSSRGSRIALQIAPLHIGSLMERHLWHQKTSVILTSATLTTHGSFDYIRDRLFAADADEIVLGSPFDYESSTLLYIADNIPEPSDYRNFQRSVEQTLVHLSKAVGGQLMALFTSYAQLRQTARAITPLLLEHEIRVYEQGSGASANSLLDAFKSDERSILLGTRSFWEGVDIPGEKLSVLVIVKLPFDVPSDPIIAARSESFDDPFSEYTLPEAILRFRQGFGRLIRSKTDIGAVIVLDRRILTKRYGRMFIESLPECNVQVGPLANISKSVTRWLGF